MRQASWCLLFVVVFAGPADAQVDQALAQQYFKEAQALCERDGGRLWGVSLCGPMVIADAATGTIATSQPAPAGDRPRALGFVNAPIQWGGETWSAYTWQSIPPGDRTARGGLFMHELFHRIQDGLGLTREMPKLPPGSGENAHLDSLEGQAIIAGLRRRYVDGPVLIVPRAGSGSVNNMGATVIPRRGDGVSFAGDQRRVGSDDTEGRRMDGNHRTRVDRAAGIPARRLPRRQAAAMSRNARGRRGRR